jgi:hypothetical protein
MKIAWLLISFSLIGMVQAQDSPAADTIQALAPYNFILGTNAIGGKYQFTSESKLYEQARRIRAMGSNVLKISLGPNSPKSYNLKIDGKPSTTLDLFLSSPEYKKVFDMDFKYIFSWVHTNTGINWKNGINQAQEKQLYDEMYQFAAYLLKTYNHSHKTFLIGNWEGDWLLLPDYNRNQSPSKEHVQNMTQWFRIRQRAIDDAKKASTSQNVELYYYIEVNLVLKGIRGESCVASDIVPKVNPDLVSYSSYEAIKNRSYNEKKNSLEQVFGYLEKQLQPKNGLPFSRRVFIGEYGYQANSSDPASFTKQYNETKDIMKVSLELNLPFALHWQMYNNEYGPDGASKQMSLIDESGKKMPLYWLHKHYYDHMNRFLTNYNLLHKTYPPDTLFRKEALQFLEADRY